MKHQTHDRQHPPSASVLGLLALLLSFSVIAQAQQEPTVTAPVVSTPAQVQFQLQLAEVDRRVLRELITAQQGLTNSAVPVQVTGNAPADVKSAKHQRVSGTLPSPSTINLLTSSATGLAESGGLISALQARAAWRDLVAPWQVQALDGRSAKVLVGGESPVPVLQADGQGQHVVTAQVKEFGLRLNLQPVILDETHLRLEVAPDLTGPDFNAGLKVEQLVIPGWWKRQARLVLELREGQSFALTGLFDTAELTSWAKIPALPSESVLSELLKSRVGLRNETELLLLITVKLSGSSAAGELAKQPNESAGMSTATRPAVPRLAGLTGHAVGGHAVSGKADSASAGPGIQKEKQPSDIAVQVESSAAKLVGKPEKRENESP